MSARLERVLVTGAAGFIGSAFVRRLLARHPQARVWSLDALTGPGGRMDNLRDLDRERHVLVRGDVCDARQVQALIDGQDIDTIVHLAAESHVDRSIAGPAAFVRTNIQGTATLLEAARAAWCGPGRSTRGRRFHQVSTDEVFGDRQVEANAADEDSAFAPRSPYAASKAAADHLVGSYHHTYGLPTSITFSCNNLGPRQDPEKLVPLVIARSLRGESLPLYGAGTQVRRWLYVDDHCDALLAVIEGDCVGERFAVGPSQGTGNLELVRRLCAVLDQRLPAGAPHAERIVHVSDRPGHDRLYHTRADRLEQRLGWRPTLDLGQALARTVDWYLAHPDWLRQVVASARWRAWERQWYRDRPPAG